MRRRHAGLAIHRDIKPGNLMLRPDGSVKILDFGLARLMAHSQYRATTRVGSVAYMAPEQFDGATGLNADLWALGITFYQLVTNTLPFPARDEASLLRQILYEPPELAPLETAPFEPRLARVVAKVLEKDPEKRYQRAAEFVADLRAARRHAAFADAAEFAELAVLAVKGTAAAAALRAVSARTLAGKAVIDATNPIAEAPPSNGVLRFFTSLDESLMERLQKEFPDVRLVKAFNSVGNARMVNPEYAGGKPTMFICGNDAVAKKPEFSISSDGKPKTWEGSKPPAPSSRYACFGASPAFSAISGRTRSSS